MKQFWTEQERAELDQIEAELIGQGVPPDQAAHQAENLLEKRQQRREEAASYRQNPRDLH